ncbi:MAG: Hpt domain-containing protein [Candidatus Competibacteraceae bacterium]|nr:Hpt domain-containing protein [Candidatus Competibacteraceae bacterium]HRY14956.1 Hpt domain-containing protein [Candidatus Competibacteraceae bacterium]
MDDYLSKPFTTAQRDAVLTRWLPQRGSDAHSPPAPVSLATESTEDSEESAILEEFQLAQIRALHWEGSPNPLTRVIQLYLENAPRQIEALCAAIVAADAPQIRAAAHALKSASTTLGAMVMATTCQSLETIGRENCLENAVAVFADLEQIFAQTCGALTALPEAHKLSLASA